MTGSRWARTVALGLMVGLVLAGCSDDDPSGTDADDGAVVDFEPQEPEIEYALPDEDLGGEPATGRVVFHSMGASRQLHLVDATGSTPNELVVGDHRGVGAPAVAPDGETLAVLAWAPDAVEVATTLLVGTLDQGLEPVLDDPDLDMWCVRWYPSGDRLLLTAFVDDEMSPALLAVDLDGTTRRVEVPAGRFDCAVPLDDHRVALTYLGMDIQLMGLAVVDTTSGEAEVLFEKVGCLLYGGSLSPDGEEIAVAAACEEPDDSGVHVVEVGSGTVDHVLVGELGFPAWAPAGDWLTMGAYATPSATSSKVWVVRRDGSGARRLTDEPGTQPAWVR